MSTPWPTCGTCGQPLPQPAEYCECGDAKAEHHVTDGGNVTYCCHIGPVAGEHRPRKCACKAYTPARSPS